jgi:hypothetical protein
VPKLKLEVVPTFGSYAHHVSINFRRVFWNIRLDADVASSTIQLIPVGYIDLSFHQQLEEGVSSVRSGGGEVKHALTMLVLGQFRIE